MRDTDAKIRAGCEWAQKAIQGAPGTFVPRFENGRWVYALTGVSVRPEVFVPILKLAACGDTGGRTKRGQPCKLKPLLHGRCAKHPLDATALTVLGDWPDAEVDIDGHRWRPTLEAAKWRHQPAQPVYDADLDRAAEILGVSFEPENSATAPARKTARCRPDRCTT